MNTFKQGLQQGRAQIGLWQALASPYCAEICAGAGFDWLLIDAEHAPNDLPLVLAQLQAIGTEGPEPVVRLPTGDPVLIKQYLDIGARTLLIPMIETPEQAAAVVRATRYPPRGIRGVGAALARASRWNRRADYFATAEDDICVLVQVESVAALDRLESIAATEGVDGVFVGPSDLAASLGHLGAPTHPVVREAVEGAIARIRDQNVAAGILIADEVLARRYLQLGALFVAVGTDLTLLARAVEALARRFDRAPAAPPAGVTVY